MSLGRQDSVEDEYWKPKSNRYRILRTIPEVLTKCLIKNAHLIDTLNGVSIPTRHWFCDNLCRYGKMNARILRLLVWGSAPTELRLRGCSQIAAEDFMTCMELCDMRNMKVIQLNRFWVCIPDLARPDIGPFLESLSALKKLSLREACNLSDDGLGMIVRCSRALTSIDFGGCHRITAAGIETIANALGSTLRELYVDDCRSIDATLALPAIQKLKHLQVLSLSGLRSVCDHFVSEFTNKQGWQMKKLYLDRCVKLTYSSVRAIAQTCGRLCVLELSYLTKLTDSSLHFLMNKCPEIRELLLDGNHFSDGTIAQYLSGMSLQTLTLCRATEVGNNTALAIAHHLVKLQHLDLSYCRDVTENAMGLIVDSCLSLKTLRIQGCTQVTSRLLNGHSNQNVVIHHHC